MALSKTMLALVFLFVICENYSEGSEASSSSNNDDSSSIPMIASGKRQHNIMRFGKRPAMGHNLIRFGKRGSSKAPQHSFLSFGKRMEDQESLPDLLQYLQKTRDNSYKRGHTIMRFGKRTPESHNFIRFGRDGNVDEDFEGYYGQEGNQMDEEKREGHNMMYFGKRAAGHNMLSFGKRAHSMIHFGKREDPGDEGDSSLIDYERMEEDDNFNPDDPTRPTMQFQKREFEDEVLPYWNPSTYEKKQHNLLRFGKKMDGPRRGSHAMIHFGKRDDDKRAAHSMIHFGKRSVDQNAESVTKNESVNGSTQTLTRMKRDVESIGNPNALVDLIRYRNNGDDDELPEEVLENAMKFNLYHEIPDDVLYPDNDQTLLPIYSEYQQPGLKKDASKNVFLRFG